MAVIRVQPTDWGPIPPATRAAVVAALQARGEEVTEQTIEWEWRIWVLLTVTD
jgi:hypothetical protein